MNANILCFPVFLFFLILKFSDMYITYNSQGLTLIKCFGEVLGDAMSSNTSFLVESDYWTTNDVLQLLISCVKRYVPGTPSFRLHLLF